MRCRGKEIANAGQRTTYRCIEEMERDLFREVRIPSIFTFLAALKASSRARELDPGRKIHSAATESGDISSNFVVAAAIDMYASCGSMADARQVFEASAKPDVGVWNAMVMGYARNRESKLALELFSAMDATNARSYVAAITACSCMAGEEHGREVEGKVVKHLSLEKGMEIHSRALRSGCCYSEEIFVENSLVDMYGKCGSLVDARRVFDRMMFHDVISWNSLMVGCVESGETEMALELFHWIQIWREFNGARVYVTALTACSHRAMKEEWKDIGSKLVKVGSLEKVLEIHCLAAVTERNFYDQVDLFVGNTLIEAYSKCSSMLDARRAFDRMKIHDAVSWTSLILGYTGNDEREMAVELFSVMATRGCCELDSGSFVAALTACSSLERVQEFHSRFLEAGCYDNAGAVVQNSLIDAYSRCERTQEAKSVFDSIENPTVASWNALILAHEENDEPELALDLFLAMLQRKLCSPNAKTLVAALTACGNLSARPDSNKLALLQTGVSIHREAERLFYDSEACVKRALRRMYECCGSFEAAPTFSLDQTNVFDPGLRKL